MRTTGSGLVRLRCGVNPNLVARRSAEQTIYRNLPSPPSDIPQRHVDRGKHMRHKRAAAHVAMGAEQLLGQGDMLYLPPGTGYPQRVHGAFVADQEVHHVVDYLKSRGQPQYIDSVLESAESDSENGMLNEADVEKDPLYDQAVEIVLKSRRASISLVQRHLRIGYNRAARLVEQMENAGLVSAMSSSGGREVLVPAREEA